MLKKKEKICNEYVEFVSFDYSVTTRPSEWEQLNNKHNNSARDDKVTTPSSFWAETTFAILNIYLFDVIMHDCICLSLPEPNCILISFSFSWLFFFLHLFSYSGLSYSYFTFCLFLRPYFPPPFPTSVSSTCSNTFSFHPLFLLFS